MRIWCLKVNGIKCLTRIILIKISWSRVCYVEQQLEQLWWSTSPRRIGFDEIWTWQPWWSTRRTCGPVPSRRNWWRITPIFSLLSHIGCSDNVLVAVLLLVRDSILKFEMFWSSLSMRCSFMLLKFWRSRHGQKRFISAEHVATNVPLTNSPFL